MPSLRVRLEPVQLKSQIQLIQDGTIDIVCGPATNTLKRQEAVAFSNTIFVSSIRAVVRTNSHIEASVMDDVLLSGLVANSLSPGKWRIIDDALRVEPYGLILPKQDPLFKALVNETLGTLIENGEFEKLYDKWFMSPIPSKDVNLNFPMSAPLKDALAHPNDRGV